MNDLLRPHRRAGSNGQGKKEIVKRHGKLFEQGHESRTTAAEGLTRDPILNVLKKGEQQTNNTKQTTASLKIVTRSITA